MLINLFLLEQIRSSYKTIIFQVRKKKAEEKIIDANEEEDENDEEDVRWVICLSLWIFVMPCG